MVKVLKFRGGTTSQHSTFTGSDREITVDTDKDTLVVHDGTTAGGFAIARESVVNTALNTKVDKNANITASTNTKITYDAKGLVTGGTTLAATDIPLLDASKVTTGILPVLRGGTGTSTSTGTGSVVLSTSPILSTPNIGVASGTSFNSIAGLSSVAPLASGTAAVGTSTLTARQDHVHPVQTTISGNAGTATTLAIPRLINGTSFNGSADITVPVNTTQKSDAVSYNIPFVSNITAGNQNLYTDSVSNLTYNPSTNSLSTTTFVGSLTGNASTATTANTATTLVTARNITLSGDVSGTASFNGGADASITAIVADNSHLHTIANVTGLQTALDNKVDDTEKGSANGVATLDVNSKVVLTQIPDSVLGQLEYQGVWDFTTLPTATQKGQYWISSVSGNGYIVGDWAVWNGLSFDKVDNTDAVASVAGRTGNVVLTKSDVGLDLVDNTTDASKNVLSATKLTTTRNIALTGDVTGNVNFDGSGNVSIATAIALNSVALGTDTTGNYVAGNTAGTGITVTGTAGEGWSPTISIDGTVATLTGAQTLTNKTLQDSTTFIVDNTDATKKVQFDVAGVTTATTRTMTIPNVNGTLITSVDTGTVTSTMILDGTIVNADINASAGIVDTKLATISTAGKVANTATTATNLNTINAIVARDASGNFSAGTVTAALSGNATTATTLQTARTITIGNTGKTFDGSANVSWSISDIGAQPIDADLTAIGALVGTTGLLKKTAADTWTLDTNAYVTSSGVTSVSGTAPIVSSGGNTPSISINAATTSAAGSMSAADKVKLDGIATNANNYTLPTATSTAIGGVKVSATTQTVAGNAVTATASRSYAVQLDASGNALVNVPWVDTNTVYTHPTSGVTAGSYSKVTVDANGHVTAGLTPTMEDIPEATFKRSARCATTANLAGTYASNILTMSAVGVITIDGIAVAINDRILIKDQTAALQNGIYYVSTLGTASVAAVFTRTLDANTSSKIASALVAVDSGTANGGKLFDNDFLTTSALGTTDMAWASNLDSGHLSSTTPIVAGTGAAGTGTTVARGDHVHPAQTSVTGNAGTATTLATGRTIGMTGDVTWTSASFNGSGNVTGVATLATITDSGTGTFKKITTNTKGLVTGTQAVAQADITGLLGAGSITNTMLANTAVTNLSGTNTGDQTITLTGDVTGAGTGSFATTLANSGVTAGTFSKVTVDAKGRVTAGLIPTMEDIPDATFKRSVKASTTDNITLSAPQTIDGIAVIAGDRVLVKNQTTTSQNGIYVVNAAAWTRALDADTASKIASALVAVDSGTTNGGKLFDNDFKTTDILGTTAMLWSMNLDEGSLLTVGSTSVGIVKYNGTTAAAGNFDGGTTTPTGATRLNYGGYFYPTYLNLTASGVETAASSHILMEKSSDGFVRRKTLANFKTEMFASPTLVTPTISGKSTNPYISTNRAVTAASGIEWFNSTHNTWIDYMAQAGVAAQGPKGNITPSAGALVTSWGKRSFIENSTGFGWTFESGVNTSTSPTVMAEISSVDGSAKFGGTVTAPSFVGSLSGNASTATALQTARTINGVSFDGTANINIEDRLGTAIASAATTTVGTAGLGDYMHITGVVTITSLGTASAAGIRRTLIFDGALTLTHNATSLICPGAASIVTVAGTVIEVIAETTANWRVVSVTHPSIGMAELGYLDGVTSSIQTQMNLKAPLASPALTGTPTAPTAVIATNSTQVATTAFAKLASDPINSLRSDRYLALQNIATMIYTSGNLTKIQYNNATDVNYEILTYDINGNLSTIQHYVASTLKGTTTLSYTSGNLVSAIFA